MGSTSPTADAYHSSTASTSSSRKESDIGKQEGERTDTLS